MQHEKPWGKITILKTLVISKIIQNEQTVIVRGSAVICIQKLQETRKTSMNVQRNHCWWNSYGREVRQDS